MFLKKAIAWILTVILIFPLAACGSQPASLSATTEEDVSPAGQEMPDGSPVETKLPARENEGEGSNILVAYFSWADNAVLAEDVDAVASPSVIPPGNVQQLAGWVQEETGGDLFSIRVTELYSSDWDECLDRANQENRDNIHPELEEVLESTADYDTVFIGYPNWWYSCPMAIFSFIDEHDLAGKDIYLFCSHGTGGLAGSVEDISAALPDSNVSDNVFDVYEEDAPSAREELLDWLSGIGF